MKNGSTKVGVDLARRKALTVGLALVSAKLVSLVGCSDDTSASGSGGSGGAGAGGSGGTGGTGGGSTATGNPGGWASGGTAGMADDYPDPFTEGLGTTCALTCASTLGPCYAQTIERKDISEGYPGLPVRLAFLVVDESCTPVAGAAVDIWHTSIQGLYSGDDAASMCTGDDEDATSHRFFRGVQSTDDEGRVDFDTCFPGWYSSRTVHIHFTVRVGGQEYVTSQLFFPQALVAEIFSTHGSYTEFGQPDTTNATDGIYSADGELETAQMADGAMLAWKVLVLRSSLSDPICGNSGGPGGPPPGG